MPLSGQTTVTTTGTAVPLGDQPVNAPLTVKALPTNTGTIFVGNNGSGDVDAASGFPLAAGDQITFDFVGHLASIFIDASVNGEGVSWLVLNA